MKNSEQSAFPHPSNQNTYPGLTKREYFAIESMKALMAGPPYYDAGGDRIGTPEQFAGAALIFADELLKQLES
jgi:hypothetical protein